MSESRLRPPRGIDHLVVAVHDLDAARAAYARLGFTLTPPARHPFGTSNSLVQLDGGFLELLAVADPAAIPDPGEGQFSFGAFNRAFLESQEGLSMLVLRSSDPEVDRADFAARGLTVYEPFGFERTARGPDGIERKVAFSLTFTSDRRLKQAGFFTCMNHYPENFWRADYQHHANGATRIAAAVMVARDPADFHEFLTHFTGQHDMHSDSLGIALDTGAGRVEVLSPVGYKAFFGEDVGADPVPRFRAMRIAVADLMETRRVLEASEVPFEERMKSLVVPASVLHEVTVAFTGAQELT